MILTEGKFLPCFVFMKEEGEVWQVTHESQVNVCWKCGNSGHVGARCNQPKITFDALERGQQAAGDGGDSGVGDVGVRSWAHVVRAGSTENELQKQDRMQRQLAKCTRLLCCAFMLVGKAGKLGPHGRG